MSHYIEAYATWDMNKMIEIIYNGLKELNRAFEFATNRSPPKKKTKPTPEKYRRPLDFINMILASANLHTYVVQKFGEHLPEFLDVKHEHLAMCYTSCLEIEEVQRVHTPSYIRRP